MNFADIEQAIQELYGVTASAILEGLLTVATGKLASVINGLGSSARVLVGTGNNNKNSDSNQSHHRIQASQYALQPLLNQVCLSLQNSLS